MSQISTDMEFIPYKDITLGQVWQYAEEYCADHCGQLMVDDDCLYFMTENSDQTLVSLVFDTGAEMSCQNTIQHIMSLVGLDLAGRSMALMSSNSLVAAADTLQSLHSNLITNATLNTAFMINKADKEIIQLQQHRTASMLKSLYLVMSRNISNMSRSNLKEAEILARYLVEASDFFVAARNTIVLSLQSDFSMNKLLLLKEELQEEDRTSYFISQMKKPSVDFSDYPDVMFRNSNFNFMMLHMLLQTNLLCMVYEGKIYGGITMNELSQVTSSDMAMLRQQMMYDDDLMGGAISQDRKNLLISVVRNPDAISSLQISAEEKTFLKKQINAAKTLAIGGSDDDFILRQSLQKANALVPVSAETPPAVGPSAEELERKRQDDLRYIAAKAAEDERRAFAALEEEKRKSAAAAAAARPKPKPRREEEEEKEEAIPAAAAPAPAVQGGPGIFDRLAQGAQALNAAAQAAFSATAAATAAAANSLRQGATQASSALFSSQSDDDLVREAERLNLSPEIIATLRQQSSKSQSLLAEAKKLQLSESFIAQLEAQQTPQITAKTDVLAQLKLAKELGLSDGFVQSYQAKLS